MAEILQDPLIIITSLIILAAIIILIWASKNLYMMNTNKEEELTYEDPAPVQQTNENSGIQEARSNEMENQLSEIVNQLNEIEKNLNSKKSFNDTVSVQSTGDSGQISSKLDSILAKLDTMATGKTGSPIEGLDRLEAKIDSVRKLLVLLSDSNNPSE